MKAVVQDKYGHADEVLSIQDVDEPVPADHEVLVQVRAASIHPDVWHTVNGFPLLIRLMGAGTLRPKRPIPGLDLAGTVRSVGKNVTRFKVGDEVFGVTVFMRLVNGGAFAEFAAVPADRLAHKPSHVSFEQAASASSSGVIALVNLRPERIAAHHHVLINGAGGNVGSLAVQMAKARGARVTGVDASSKFAMLRALGVDRVIDYTREDFTRGTERYDFILDVASTSSAAACKRVLTPNGRYWIIGHDHFGEATGRVFGSIPRMIGFMLSQSFSAKASKLDFKLPPIEELMETLRRQLEARELTPIVAKIFPLDQVQAAMRCMVEGNTLGRIVIAPSA